MHMYQIRTITTHYRSRYEAASRAAQPRIGQASLGGDTQKRFRYRNSHRMSSDIVSPQNGILKHQTPYSKQSRTS